MLKQPSRQQLWIEPFLGGLLSDSSLQIDSLCAAGAVAWRGGGPASGSSQFWSPGQAQSQTPWSKFTRGSCSEMHWISICNVSPGICMLEGRCREFYAHFSFRFGHCFGDAEEPVSSKWAKSFSSQSFPSASPTFLPFISAFVFCWSHLARELLRKADADAAIPPSSRNAGGCPGHFWEAGCPADWDSEDPPETTGWFLRAAEAPGPESSTHGSCWGEEQNTLQRAPKLEEMAVTVESI